MKHSSHDRVVRRQFLFSTLGLAAVSSLPKSWLGSALGAGPDAAELKSVVGKAYEFLKRQQKANGSFAPPQAGEPGVTALTVAALVRNGYAATDPVVAGGLKYLEAAIQTDGGVYNRGLANYTTCLAVMAFKDSNTGGKYDAVIGGATKFLRTLQFGTNDDVAAPDAKFGGAGYDKKGTRGGPDLSNTHYFMEALLAGGASQDDPAVKKAIAFVSRTQNLPSEFNELPYATKVADDDKGGFVYNPAAAADEKSDKRTAIGGLRSEGGMTYAGLKSFLYAGVAKSDPRVQAALKWVRAHYTLTENPGMGANGLFYYYHTFAKAMAAVGEDNFEDAKGIKHDWRQELFTTLKGMQQADGSWANQTSKAYLENLPELATAFAVLALSYCKA